jgi:AcrR family transcriptional regulator
MRERILQRAVELFNERGVEYVGVRELAKDLGIKGGNINYYFPTKDDLVFAVGELLRERNDATLRIPEAPSLAAYMEMLAAAFRNQYAFRGLFLSMPNLMLRNRKLAAGYVGNVEKQRRRVLREYLGVLQDSGFLRTDVEGEVLDRTVSFIGLVTRAWIGDASISFRDRTPEWCMEHYLAITADHLAGLATEKGLEDLGRAGGAQGRGRGRSKPAAATS